MTDTDMNDWNSQVIAEFRANDGKVASFGDAPMVILHHTGAKSGLERETPLVPLIDGDSMYLIASKAGAPTHPDWYHNLKANPKVEIEYGTERFTAEVSEVGRTERDELYAKQVAVQPGFADYEKATTRVIPVLAVTRV